MPTAWELTRKVPARAAHSRETGNGTIGFNKKISQTFVKDIRAEKAS